MAEPQNGRIGGGVLADNLLRNGLDLNFKNTTSDTALLQFDVTNDRIGVNIESPADRLHVVNTFGSTNLLAPYLNIANITLQTNEINANVGNLIFSAGSSVLVQDATVDDIRINDNSIYTTQTDSNLELRPNGSGVVEFVGNTNITGSLHATGDITFGGNLTLGNDADDSVDFESDVNSDLIPDATDTYSLGSASKRWQNLYSDLLKGQRVEIGAVAVSDTSLALRQGNIFYVSTLGSDTNVGDHQHGAFRTIEHALAVADSSTEGPVTIFIYPGEYEENLPLIVPENTTITGEDIRNVIVKPAAGSESLDVFHLNQNTMVENITAKDFYYDSINDTGYAFRFAAGAVIAERSPYVRNVTAITQESSTGAGDAGRGALVDGSVLDSNTTSPSMLFHSATFITPNADCIVMTNGVRVEWLNSFTYFANRGLYATQGSLGFASLATTFGAEIRSIGSANVYGTYGAVADGADTLMYLIGHNFGYIGAGLDYSNDRTLTLQDQEAVELNSGRIYYTSTDADGTFRVGNAFYVDFENGTTSIDAGSVDFSGVSALFIRTGPYVAYIDGERIDLGNIRISGNTVETLAGDLIWSPATGVLDVSTNNTGFILPRGTTAQRISEQSDLRYNTTTNLFEGFSSANVGFSGIYSDNRLTNINANNVLGNIVFTANNVETARVSTGKLELNGLTTGDVYANLNILRTTQSNSNLELLPDGSGVVVIDNLNLNASIIENTSNANLSLYSTNRGYVKFDSTVGVVLPVGGNLDRPTTPLVGDTRWNTDEDYLETWDGSTWIKSSGEGETVTEVIMGDILDIYTLVLG